MICLAAVFNAERIDGWYVTHPEIREVEGL